MRDYKLLEEVAFYSEDRVQSSNISIDNFVTTDNILQNKQGIVKSDIEPKGTLIGFSSGDILIANIRPYLRKIWYAKSDGGCSQDVLVVKSKKGIDSKFLFYSLFRDDFFRHVMKGAKGTKMPRGDKNQIMRFHIPDFEPHIQEKIGSILFAIDSKIELNNRINAELEAMAKTIYDYWFVQFEFPDKKGKPYKTSGGKMVWNEELKREIAEGWEVNLLSRHLVCNKNTISKKDELSTISYLDTSSLTENHIDSIQKINSQTDSVPSRAQRIVKENDILISTVRPNLRHFGIIKKPVFNMIASTGFAILSHKTETKYNDFFYMFITSDPIQRKLESIAASAVSSYPSINPSDILDLPIALPGDFSIVKEISKTLSNIFLTVSVNQQQNHQLTELRDWLLPMLMNGQVKVKEAEEMLSMAAEGEAKYKKRSS
jgi:type I restriction enzyme S subunit